MTKNPFIRYTQDKLYRKAVVWGEPKHGKTLFAINAPQAVRDKLAFISLENGEVCYQTRFGLQVAKVSSLEELNPVIKFLRQDQYYDTVVIDSMSVVWHLIRQDKRYKTKKGEPDWVQIKAVFQQTVYLFLTMKKHVLFICGAKPETGENWYDKTGKFLIDCEYRIKHNVDFVLQAIREGSGKEAQYTILLEEMRGLGVGEHQGERWPATSFYDFCQKVNAIEEESSITSAESSDEEEPILIDFFPSVPNPTNEQSVDPPMFHKETEDQSPEEKMFASIERSRKNQQQQMMEV